MAELLIEADEATVVMNSEGAAISGRDTDGNHAGFALTHSHLQALLTALLRQMAEAGGAPAPSAPEATAVVPCHQIYTAVAEGAACLVLDFGPFRLPVLLPPDTMRRLGNSLLRGAAAMSTPPGRA